MANFVSPGVYVVEKDNSDYPVSINPSVVGLVGFANRGPVNDATLITAAERLTQVFGRPSETIYGQGLEGALEILEATNSLYFIRAASDDATEAKALVPLGACPAAELTASGFGTSAGLVLKAQVFDENGIAQFNTPKTYIIPASTPSVNTQGKAVRQAIGGPFDGAKLFADFDTADESVAYIGGGFAGSSCQLFLSAFEVDGSTPVDVLKALDIGGNPTGSLSSVVQVRGTTLLADNTNSSVCYEVESLYPGAGYNRGITAAGGFSGTAAVVQRLGSELAFLGVEDEGAISESYKVGLVDGASFIEDVINTGRVDATSEYIQGRLIASGEDFDAVPLTQFADKLSVLGAPVTAYGVGPAEAVYTVGWDGSYGGGAAPGASPASSPVGASPRFCKVLTGTYGLAGGDSGIPTVESEVADALIGEALEPKTGMQALDDDLLNISMAAVPGITIPSVQNALVTLAESTQNFLAVVAPPYAIGGAQEAIEWTNGLGGDRTGAISSSYAAVYWPWVKTFSPFDGSDRWYDPSIFAIRQMCVTDEVADPWFAPAGFNRGRLTKPSDVEVRLNQGDRDALYSGGNVVNPVVNFPQQGITIFGQRTAQRTPTALDRVNVRRMMIVLRKTLLASTRQFAFEPNDSVTWEKITNVVEPLVDDIRRRRGITEFKVICDETTNTPVRVDRNELWCKVLIKPTKTAEIIVFELNLTNQSATL